MKYSAFYLAYETYCLYFTLTFLNTLFYLSPTSQFLEVLFYCPPFSNTLYDNRSNNVEISLIKFEYKLQSIILGYYDIV